MTARIVPPDYAVAVDRFNPDGLTGYRARTMPSAPVRATRGEALTDELRWLDGEEWGVVKWLDSRPWTSSTSQP